jgi:hypothetical protein
MIELGLLVGIQSDSVVAGGQAQQEPSLFLTNAEGLFMSPQVALG